MGEFVMSEIEKYLILYYLATQALQYYKANENGARFTQKRIIAVRKQFIQPMVNFVKNNPLPIKIDLSSVERINFMKIKLLVSECKYYLNHNSEFQSYCL